MRYVGCCGVEFLSAVFLVTRDFFRLFPVFCSNGEGDAMGPVDYMHRHQWLFFSPLGWLMQKGYAQASGRGGGVGASQGRGRQARRKKEGFPLTLWWSALRWDERGANLVMLDEHPLIRE